MFTGLIECEGVITRADRVGDGMRLEVYAPEFGRDMQIGDSIAVDGACLTVVNVHSRRIPDRRERRDSGAHDSRRAHPGLESQP